MIRSLSTRLLPLALAIAAAGCAPSATVPAAPAPGSATTTATPPDDAALTAYFWRLTAATAADGSRIDALFPDPQRPLQLRFIDGYVSVANSCNGISGPYRLAAGTLSVTQLVQTQMACMGALMRTDAAIGDRLQGDSALTFSGGAAPTLTLVAAAGDTLVFTGVPTPETRYGSAGERLFLEVAPQRVACHHPLIPAHRCLRVREIVYGENGVKQREGEWAFLYGDIEGYTHEPGIRNVLRIKRFALPDPPADGAASVDVLDMVVESERVGD